MGWDVEGSEMCRYVEHNDDVWSKSFKTSGAVPKIQAAPRYVVYLVSLFRAYLSCGALCRRQSRLVCDFRPPHLSIMSRFFAALS